jgi:hypothetical protein
MRADDAQSEDLAAVEPEDARKYPSGAQKRKAARERAAEEAQRERERRAAEGGLPDHTKIYERLGPPPLDPVGGVAYGNRAAQLLLEVVIADPAMPLPDKLRNAKDLIAVIGMTHAKAITDDRISNLEAENARLRQERGADQQDVLDEHPAAGRTASGP